jgi:hypothetical protein
VVQGGTGVSPIEGILQNPDEPVDEQLAALAKEYAEARDLASDANARKEAARDRILALVGDAGKVVAGSYFISVTEQTRKSLDTKAVRIGAEKLGFDLTPYEKVSTTKVLRVA